MRCVITIIQNKRIALPYIFNKYCLPMYKKCFRGDVKLFHIFHNCHGNQGALYSNASMGEGHVRKVMKFIKDKQFPEAKIIEHNTVSKEWPALPSYKLAIDVAIREKADFHLWMEDDAIIYDRNCNTWALTLGSGDIGLYRDTDKKEMVNIAYFLSTNEYDRRLKRLMHEFYKGVEIPSNLGNWGNYAGKGSLIEHMAWRASRKPILLERYKAYRHHPHKAHNVTGTMVKEWLKKTIPDISKQDLWLLNLDFND
jgi:hypothetical protein